MLNCHMLLKKRKFICSFGMKRRYKASLDVALYLQPEVAGQIHSQPCIFKTLRYRLNVVFAQWRMPIHRLVHLALAIGVARC